MTASQTATEIPTAGAMSSATGGDLTGLTEAEAARRLAQYGENALVEHHVSVLERLAHFFLGADPVDDRDRGRALRRCCRHWGDLAIILAMLFINAGVGFWQEFKADNAIALLKQRLALKARVKRDGAWKDIAAKLLVPGDVVHVKLGNVVPADLKLIGGGYLSVDQSALTGESLPVDKKAGDDAYSGSIAKQGEMDGLATATGMKTHLATDCRSRRAGGNGVAFPARVLRIGNFLIVTTAGLVVIIVIAGLFRHNPSPRTGSIRADPAVA